MTAVDQRSIHHGFAVNPDLTQHKGESALRESETGPAPAAGRGSWEIVTRNV